MHLRRLDLCNYGRHDRLTFEPRGAVIGVVGRNGSGKSTVLAAIRQAITGVPGPFGKSAGIRLGAGTDEPSWVRVDGEHDGRAVTIVRVLRGGASTLAVDGVELARGERAVAATLSDLLGVSYPVLGEVAFVPQKGMDAFLDDEPSARRAAILRMLGLHRAEAIHRALSDALEAEPPVPDHAGELDRARAERDAAERDLDRLAVELARVTVPAVPDPPVASGSGPDLGAVERARTAIAQAPRIRARNRQRAALTKRLDGVHDRAADLSATLGDWYREEGHLDREERDRIVAEVSRLERLLRSLSDGVAECPTCSTPVARLTDVVAEAELDLPHLRAKLIAIDRSIAVDAEAAALDVEANEIRARLDAMGPFEAEPDVVAASAVLDAWGRAEREHTATLSAYRQALAARDAAVATRNELVGRIASARDRVARADAAIATIHAAIEASASRASWRATLTDARAAFHRDAAPRAAARSALASVVDRTNLILAQFDQPIALRADDALDLWAETPDGEHPAGMLSGGQRDMAALAFRIAACSAGPAAGIGLVCLDEPGASLDRANRIAVVDQTIRILDGLAADRGLQCFLVTHDAPASAAFHSTLSL